MQIRHKRTLSKKNISDDKISITNNDGKFISYIKNDLTENSLKYSSNEDSRIDFLQEKTNKPKLRNIDSNYQGMYKKMITGKFLNKSLQKIKKRPFINTEKRRNLRFFPQETVKFFENFIDRLSDFEIDKISTLRKKNSKTDYDNITLKLFSDDTLNPNIISDKPNESKINRDESYKQSTKNPQFQHILLENKGISQNNEFPIYVRNPVLYNFGVNMFSNNTEKRIYPSKYTYNPDTFDYNQMSPIIYQNERSNIYPYLFRKANFPDIQSNIRSTLPLNCNRSQEIISKHTPNHISIVNFIKLSQEQSSNILTNNKMELNKVKERSYENSNKSTTLTKQEKIEKNDSPNIKFPDVSKFKIGNNSTINFNNLINSCNVEDLTKSQLDQIKDIVSKSFDKDVQNKSTY